MPPKSKSRMSLGSPATISTPKSTPTSSRRRSTAASEMDWTLCPESGVKFHASDSASHSLWLQQGSVKTQTLHTIVSEADQAVYGKIQEIGSMPNGKWQKLGLETMAKLIFVPFPVMTALNWCICDLLLVESGEGISVNKTLLRVLPLECSIKNICVAKLTLNLWPSPFETVKISKFSQKVLAFQKVWLQHKSDEEADTTKANEDEINQVLIMSYDRHPISTRGSMIIPFYGRVLQVQIVKASFTSNDVVDQLQDLSFNPQHELGMITVDTEISWRDEDNQKSSRTDITLAGLNKELETIKTVIESNLTSISAKRSPKTAGILVWGPSGTGKTTLGKQLSRLIGANSDYHSAPDFVSKFLGESESNLKKLFKKLKSRQPSVLFIDEIDCLCGQRGQERSDQERRMTLALASILDEISQDNLSIVVIGATHSLSVIDSSLRRSGRFDIEVEFGIPTPQQRLDILLSCLSQVETTLTLAEVNEVAMKTHGFVGADLQSLVSTVVDERVEEQVITLEGFQKALRTVKPSAMREVMIEVPSVTWDDIGGLDELKLGLRQAIEWPMKRPDAFERFGITPPKGVLMYGPPGCSKTMIAKALANESNVNFLAIKGPELFSKWVGESERAVRELFRKARQVSPAIIFFDEIDALGSERGAVGQGKVGERVLAQILTEMDGIEELKNVTIVAATNRPDMIDPALLRPGRLDRIFYVPLPDAETRLKVLKVHTKKKPLASDVHLETIVELTDGYSGAELTAICNEAAFKALEDDIEAVEISQAHFEKALALIKPRINPTLLEIYSKFQTERK